MFDQNTISLRKPNNPTPNNSPLLVKTKKIFRIFHFVAFAERKIIKTSWNCPPHQKKEASSDKKQVAIIGFFF